MPDGGAHGIAPSGLHGRVVVRDLEAERRLPRRIDRRATEHRRRRVGARDIQQHRFEHRVGRQRDALPVRGRCPPACRPTPGGRPRPRAWPARVKPIPAGPRRPSPSCPNDRTSQKGLTSGKPERYAAPGEARRADHSMTWSARARIGWGMVMPRALAVLRLMTSSNLVGCSTGRAAGLAPVSILCTCDAARR